MIAIGLVSPSRPPLVAALKAKLEEEAAADSFSGAVLVAKKGSTHDGLLLERLGLIGLDGSKTGGRSSLKGQIVVKRVVKACRKEKSRSIKVR